MGLYEHVEALLDVPVMNSASDAPALYGEERDAFLAASNLADATIGACNLLHNGPRNLIRTRGIRCRNVDLCLLPHLLEFNWFLICGDDRFVMHGRYWPTMREKLHQDRNRDDQDPCILAPPFITRRTPDFFSLSSREHAQSTWCFDNQPTNAHG